MMYLNWPLDHDQLNIFLKSDQNQIWITCRAFIKSNEKCTLKLNEDIRNHND